MPPVAPVVTQKHNLKRIAVISIALLLGFPMLFFLLMTGQQLLAQGVDEMPHDVVISSITKSTATITWKTDQNTQSVVEYGVSPTELHSYAPEQSPRKEHSIDLNLLKSSTPYYFQIKTMDSTYDNGGMPWTFTTKSPTGEDVTTEVRGVTSRISKVAGNGGKTITTKKKLTCSATSCADIQKNLGKGCTSSDYVKCIAANPKSGGGTVMPSPTPTGTVLGTTSSSTATANPTPFPTSVLIKSNACQFNYLQSINSCSKWSWGDSMDVQAPTCKKSFYRYVLECKRNDFNTSGGTIGKWYIYEIANTIYTIDEDLLVDGDTVYCRVRAEDKDGNATEWQNNIEPKKCE